MFQESPFSGICATSTFEVMLMLIGTLLLGVLLGYLIWGWVKGRVTELEGHVGELKHINKLKEGQIADLNTRLLSLEQEVERAHREVKAKEAIYSTAVSRIKDLSDEVDTLREQPPEAPVSSGKAKATSPPVVTPKEPVKQEDQASPARETKSMEPAGKSQPLRKGSTKASLAIAAEVMGSKIAANDLKIIEGIGPKIEEIFRKKGIKTWAKLAQSRLPELRKILEDAGPRYRLANPKTWPRQARMAAKGEWKKLRAYQETLKGGRES